MYRDERLHIIEEEPYKKGGRVKKGKKKKTRKGTAKARKSRKATGQRRKADAMRYLPLGGALPTTGMGSVVFGQPQAPSYFRAIAPEQQTFASLPGSLKALQEGQAKLLRELEKQKEQLRKDAKMARDMAETEEKEEVTRKYVSPMSSRSITPITSYSTAFSAPAIHTLRPLERQRTDTPPIMTPSATSLSSYSIPMTALRIEPTWQVSTSSREAGYMGADETLPVQAPASGANMVPEDVVYDSAPDSAFIPISASAPESAGDAVERAAQVATSASSHAPRSMSLPRKAYSPRSESVSRSISVQLGRVVRMKRPSKGYVASHEVVGSPEYISRQKLLKKEKAQEKKRQAQETVQMSLAEMADKRRIEKAQAQAQAQALSQPRKIPASVLTKLQAFRKKKETEASQSGAV